MRATPPPVSFEDFAHKWAKEQRKYQERLQLVREQRNSQPNTEAPWGAEESQMRNDKYLGYKRGHKVGRKGNAKNGGNPKTCTHRLHGSNSVIFFKVSMETDEVTVSERNTDLEDTKVLHRRITKGTARIVWTTFRRMGYLSKSDTDHLEQQAYEALWGNAIQMERQLTHHCPEAR